jgi:uncharacterized protein YdhG (YjbR/CyaY superfamily)
MQEHMERNVAPEFQRYVDGIAKEHRALFDRLHGLILSLHPEATVGISYTIPAYRVGKHRLYVGAWKHGLSVYGWKRGSRSGFMDRHPTLVTSTGTIRITPDDAATLSDGELDDLIRSALDS